MALKLVNLTDEKMTTSAIATPINVIIEICKINDVNKCFVVIPIAFKIPISDVFYRHYIKECTQYNCSYNI